MGKMMNEVDANKQCGLKESPQASKIFDVGVNEDFPQGELEKRLLRQDLNPLKRVVFKVLPLF
jgi:hypothetical protein